MAVSPKTEAMARYTVQELDKSSMPDERKRALAGMVDAAREATNGLSPEDKLQAVSENQFYMVCTLVDISRDLSLPRAATWKEVALAYKWPLVIMFAILCVALVFRPELSDLVRAVAAAASSAAPR